MSDLQVSDLQAQKQKHFYDFNHKNIALIGGVFVVLCVSLALQGSVFNSVSKLGFTLGAYHSVFATPPSSNGNVALAEGGAVLGASTLSLDVEKQMAALPIKFAYNDTVGAAQIYAQQVTVVTKTDIDQSKLAKDLLVIAVPPSLENYQRLIVTKAQLNAQLQSATTSDQQQAINANISVINAQISQVQSNFSSQGLQLP
jgi:hypothetical protein